MKISLSRDCTFPPTLLLGLAFPFFVDLFGAGFFFFFFGFGFGFFLPLPKNLVRILCRCLCASLLCSISRHLSAPVGAAGLLLRRLCISFSPCVVALPLRLAAADALLAREPRTPVLLGLLAAGVELAARGRFVPLDAAAADFDRGGGFGGARFGAAEGLDLGLELCCRPGLLALGRDLPPRRRAPPMARLREAAPAWLAPPSCRRRNGTLVNPPDDISQALNELADGADDQHAALLRRRRQHPSDS